ncbi:MAG: hypothetical protein NZ556_07365 [Fimbriimonadales bacterium]|nr:hypothetical protein [Fimbriimonadales bacterium]
MARLGAKIRDGLDGRIQVVSKPERTDMTVRATLHGLEARATKSVAWASRPSPEWLGQSCPGENARTGLSVPRGALARRRRYAAGLQGVSNQSAQTGLSVPQAWLGQSCLSAGTDRIVRATVKGDGLCKCRKYDLWAKGSVSTRWMPCAG